MKRAARLAARLLLLPLAAVFTLPAHAALTKESSRANVRESSPHASLTATNTDAAAVLASLVPAAAADVDAAELPAFDLGAVVLVESEPGHEERFDLGPLTLVDLNPLRGPPPSYPETRVGGFELLPPFRVGASPTLSLWSHQACGISCREVASDSRQDPWGLQSDESAPGNANRFLDWLADTPPARWLQKVTGWGHEASDNVGVLAEQKYRQALQTGPVDPANDEMLREAGYDPAASRGIAGGLQPGRAGKEAFKNQTSDLVRKGTSAGTEQLLYLGVASVAGRANRVRANLVRGTSFESRAQAAVEALGERVIPSQFKRGAADRGFDFLSFSGSGGEARLFINEAKDEAGRVGSRRFTAFGSKRMKTWQENLNVARQRIDDAGLDLETRETLLRQLDERRARIRVIGNPNTTFDPAILDAIGTRTGFMVGEGPRVP